MSNVVKFTGKKARAAVNEGLIALIECEMERRGWYDGDVA